MTHLEHQDFEQLLLAISLLNSDSDPATLNNRTLQSVSLLISNEMIAFDAFGTDGDYNGSLWYSPSETVSEEQIKIFGELVQEHPYFEEILFGQSPHAIKVSDRTSLGEFHRTALYNEFYKHYGGDTQLGVPLLVSENLRVTCTLLRLKNDFSHRECETLNLFAHHLISAFRNAQFINRLAIERGKLEMALEATKYGVIVLNLELNVENQNPTAFKLLQKYFESENGSLPEELRRYTTHHKNLFFSPEFYLPPPALEIKKSTSKLKVRLAFQSQAQIIILLLEEIKDPSLNELINLGLTVREAEVLFWLGQGRSDGEIAFLLGISPRTVQKHNEHVFTKLGVETRSAAMLKVLELL